jgi:hypothetical protein
MTISEIDSPLAKVKYRNVIAPQSYLATRNAKIPNIPDDVQFPIILESNTSEPFDSHNSSSS